MKRIGLVLLLAIASYSFGQDTLNPDYARKFLETTVEYKQLNQGFFCVTQSIYRKIDWTYDIAASEHNLSLGYSPWKNTFLLESNHRIAAPLVFYGLGVGYGITANGSANTWYFKLECGLNFYWVRVFYAYSWLSNKNFGTFFNRGSNITVSIPIFSSKLFLRFKDKKQYCIGPYKPWKD